MVTIPPLVVRTRASSTVLVKASSRVNLDLGGMVADERLPAAVRDVGAQLEGSSCTFS